MSTNKTENYHLHAWELGDDFLLSEINENFAALDANAVRMAAGTYTGDKQAFQDIVLGFRPSAVLVMGQDGSTWTASNVIIYGGLAVEDSPVRKSDGPVVSITDQGFRVYYIGGRGVYANDGNIKNYLAIQFH